MDERELKRSNYRPNLKIFGVPRNDPGWIYVIKNQDLLKIGKTKNPARRLEKEARTWLPDLSILGTKPFWNITFVERSIHVGLAQHWYSGEWYKFRDQNDYDFVVSGLTEFYDDNRDLNSVDFIYWMNGSGLAEICREQCRQKLTLPKFHRVESDVRKV